MRCRIMNMPHIVRAAASLLLAFLTVSAVAEEAGVTVLTELPPLYSITASLCANTRVTVQNVPPEGRRMNALPRMLEKPSAAMLESFKKTDAVVTIGKLWRESPLYAAVRAQNIRVVNIDASEPYSATLTGVTLTREPQRTPTWDQTATVSDRPSLYIWLNPSNGVRMAEIIAHDLAQLSPADSSQIARNLETFRRRVLDLKAEYEKKFAEVDDLTLFALTGEFAYLVADMGLFVDGYFVKQDVDWTAADLTHFRDYLRKQRMGVVIHKWEPSAPIQEAIRGGGAILKVLRTGEDGIVRDGALTADGYIEDLRFNLEAVYAAGKAAQSR